MNSRPPVSAPAGILSSILDLVERPDASSRLRGRNGQVVSAIGQAIVAGHYPPGATLPREAELMSELEISRTSLREAIKVLSAKGLVESRQRVGTRVRPREDWNIFDGDVLAWHHAQGMDQHILKDLIELRQTLEPLAAGLAAGRASMTDIGRIDMTLDQMRAGPSPEAYSTADVEFHLAVYAASHNMLLAKFGHLVGDFLLTSFSIQQLAAEEHGYNMEEDVTMHQQVSDAINRGDSATATSAMLDVVLAGKAALASALERSGSVNAS